MKNHCTDCQVKIPNGQATTRSISLRLVTLCGFCVSARGWEPVTLPMPRGLDREEHSLLVR